MQPMSGMDAKFLYSETATTHMHTIKVVVADVSAMAGGFTYAGFVDVLAEHLADMPALRRRAVPTPLSLGHPVWIEDPDFDLAAHLSHRTLPAPGSLRQLAGVAAEVAGAPLRRDRPLWEIVVVEGLEGGRIAVIAKLHHAVADGAATVAMLASVVRGLSHAGEGGARDPWHAEHVPSTPELLRLAAHEHVERVKGLPELAVRSVRGMRAAASIRRLSAIRPPLPLQAPRTSLNVSISAERTFAMATVDFELVRAVRRATGATVNDVFLTVCAGAVRSYLADRGELPRRSLVSSVPVGLDAGELRLSGNRVDNLYVSIGTDIADPRRRLEHVSSVAAASKRMRIELGHQLMEQRAEIVPPQLYRATVRLWGRTHLADRIRPPINLITSNVAGPRERIHLDAVDVDALYSVGPILEGVGLNLTAWSYADDLCVTALGCPESLPDPWAVTDGLGPALDELADAVGAREPDASDRREDAVPG